MITGIFPLWWDFVMVGICRQAMMIWWMVDSGRMYGGEVDAKMHRARYYLIFSGPPI